MNEHTGLALLLVIAIAGIMAVITLAAKIYGALRDGADDARWRTCQ